MMNTRTNLPRVVAFAGIVVCIASCSSPEEPAWFSDVLPGSGSVVFSSERDEDARRHLYVIDESGTRRLPVLPNEINARWVRWNHSGTALAYAVQIRGDEPNRWSTDIYVLNLEDWTTRPVVASASSNENYPRWSPDDSHLAFVSWNETPGPGVYVVRADGTEGRRLADGELADWCPDGRHVMFTRDSEILTVDIEDGTEEYFARGSDPQFSPTGEWVVVGRDGVRLLGPDGETERAITDLPEGRWQYRWSPTGRSLALLGLGIEEGSLSFGTVDVGTGRFTRLGTHVLGLEPNGYLTGPTWSPDERFFAYSTVLNRYGTEQAIFFVDVATGELRTLTDGPGVDNYPEWGPALAGRLR